jgi:hypothetical protein
MVTPCFLRQAAIVFIWRASGVRVPGAGDDVPVAAPEDGAAALADDVAGGAAVWFWSPVQYTK